MSSASGSRARRRVRTTFGQRMRAAAPPVLAGVLLAVAFVLPDASEDDRPPGPVTVARSGPARSKLRAVESPASLVPPRTRTVR